MVKLDEKKLTQLLDAEQWDEAGNLITAYLDSIELTPEEKGGAYLQFAATYLGVMNTLNEEYQKNLDQAIEGLKALEKTEKEINNRIDLGRVKSEIKRMSN